MNGFSLQQTGSLAAEPGLGVAEVMCTGSLTDTLLVVGGQRVLRMWNLKNKRLHPTNVSLGVMERNYTAIKVHFYYTNRVPILN